MFVQFFAVMVFDRENKGGWRARRGRRNGLVACMHLLFAVCAFLLCLAWESRAGVDISLIVSFSLSFYVAPPGLCLTTHAFCSFVHIPYPGAGRWALGAEPSYCCTVNEGFKKKRSLVVAFTCLVCAPAFFKKKSRGKKGGKEKYRNNTERLILKGDRSGTG